MTKTADVVVIGGGVTGTAITYYLSRKKIHAHLLEKSHLGAGTSSSSSATVALQTKSLGLKLDLARESMRLFHELKETFDTDFEFIRDGSLIVARNEDELQFLKDKAEKLRGQGVAVQIFDQREAHQYLPALSPEVVGASFCALDGSINPLLLVVAYLEAARSHGAEFTPYSEVTDIEIKDGLVQAVHTATDTIITETVINAAGPGAAAVARMAGVELPIVPRKGEILVTEAAPPLLRGELLSASYLRSKGAPPIPITDWLSGEVRVEGFQAGIAASQMQRGNLLVGSTREFAGPDVRSTYRGIRELAQQMAAILPPAADLHIIRSYAGLRPSTPDGLPILERTENPRGFLTAAGHEGDGIALSAVTGQLVAQLVTGEITDAQLVPLSSSRFLQQHRGG